MRHNELSVWFIEHKLVREGRPGETFLFPPSFESFSCFPMTLYSFSHPERSKTLDMFLPYIRWDGIIPKFKFQRRVLWESPWKFRFTFEICLSTQVSLFLLPIPPQLVLLISIIKFIHFRVVEYCFFLIFNENITISDVLDTILSKKYESLSIIEEGMILILEETGWFRKKL